MEEAISTKWIIKKRNVFLLMFLFFIAITAAFMYLFFTNTQISAIPAMVEENGPPRSNRVIYGGFGDDSLAKPMDATVIGQFIYVSDTKNKRIQVFDIGGSPLFMFGKEGEGKGEFKFPYGIAGDSKGNVYVADLYNGCISIFDSKGKFIKYFGENKPEDKTFEAPGGLRIIDNNVYITDILKNQVYVYSLNGNKILEFGKIGDKQGEFRAPNAVAVDRDGNICIADSGNQRVQIFDKTGKFLRSVNGSKDGKGKSIFVNPRGVAFDSRGILYVISNLTHYIYGFDKEGKQLFVFGGNGTANDQFSLPNGLFIDGNDQFYITDTTNQRVAVYEL